MKYCYHRELSNESRLGGIKLAVAFEKSYLINLLLVAKNETEEVLPREPEFASLTRILEILERLFVRYIRMGSEPTCCCVYGYHDV